MAGFEPERLDEGITYRLRRGHDIVDILAPDHLSDRTSRTTVPPDSTIEATGSRQALNRKRTVVVDAGHADS